MDGSNNRVFISYRRDDAAGYAGRLEEALEKRLGAGSTFRDVLDIAPGADFVAAIGARLASAQMVLVLIGPRWAGGEAPGARRIDDPADFVRLEVATALHSGARVVPVLLPGADMPLEAGLPEPLQALARLNALSLSDTHWQADVERLVGVMGLHAPRQRQPWLLAGAGLGACAVLTAAALWWLQPEAPADASTRLEGAWQAQLKYGWGDQYTERFEFKRHAGQLTGTATFLGYPRAIERLTMDGANLHFETRTQQTMGNENRDVTHLYIAELRGSPPNESLALRMQSTGGFSSDKPLEFQAKRAP